MRLLQSPYCCWSASVGCIHNLAGISIVCIGTFHKQPISQSHGDLKANQRLICTDEKHMVKLRVASYFCSGF